MPTPSSRTPVRVARGTYSNLNSSVADIQEGEICYATDQNKLYVKEGSSLESTQADVAAKANIASPTFTGTVTIPAGASIADIGSTIQAHDPDTAKTDVAQTFSAPQRGTVTEYTGTSFTINFGTTNNFILKPSGNYTVALSGLTGTKGQTGSIFIEPSAAATITGSWPTQLLFVGGDAGITLTGTSGGIDRIDYIVLDDTSGAEKITCNVTTNYVT